LCACIIACFVPNCPQEQLDTSQLRLDPLPFIEDYYAVYNGVVILAANPYINYARTLGLSSVATGGYSPKGAAKFHMFWQSQRCWEILFNLFHLQDRFPPAPLSK
jgi:hypothetical protein